jgi:hypothetical protein
MQALERYYINAMSKCENLTREIVLNSYSTIKYIHIVNEAVGKIEENLLAAGQSNATDEPVLNKPVCLSEKILRREVEKLKVSTEQLVVAIQKQINTTLKQLGAKLESDLNHAFAANGSNELEIVKRYQGVLIESIFELERMRIVILEVRRC